MKKKTSEQAEGKKCALFSTASIAFLLFGLVAVVLHVLSLCSRPAADFIHATVTVAVRGVLGYATALFPLSLVELAILLLPLWLFLLFRFVRRIAPYRDRVKRFLVLLLSILVLIYALFITTHGIGYLTKPLSAKLSLSEETPKAEDLYATALWLTEKTNALAAGLTPGENGGSEAPYGYLKMNRELNRAYANLSKKHDFIPTLYVGTKPVMLSHFMAYTGITGVYTFFSGESNVNTVYPDYATAYTAAHEMAHARGIARENEANFVAFLALIHSEDTFLQYSGYANLLQYVGNALYRTDKAKYLALWQSYSDIVKTDFRAYNEVYDKYDGTVVGEISENINNAYLEGMGTEGTISYSLVVDLAVSYYLTEVKP